MSFAQKLAGFFVVNLALLPVALGSAATGHEANDFYGPRWPIGANVHYKIDSSMNPQFTSGTVTFGDGRWSNRVSGRSPNFIYEGAQNMTNPFTPCGGPNGVFRSYMGPENGYPNGVLGFTPACFDNGRMAGFTMVINSRYQMTYADNPPNGVIDAASVLVHEFGHATGWRGHFLPGGEYCSGNGVDRTMCPTTNWRRTKSGAPLRAMTFTRSTTHTIKS